MHFFQFQTRRLVKRQLQAGFTLVELLVVMSIIGVLAGVLLTNFVGVRERAADARTKNDLRQLKTALRLYYNDFQHYPAASGGTMLGCIDGASSCSSGTFSANGTTYMSELPEDFDYYSDGLDEFLLEVELDNPSDEDIAASQDGCNPTGRGYYTGTVTPASDYFVCED